MVAPLYGTPSRDWNSKSQDERDRYFAASFVRDVSWSFTNELQARTSHPDVPPNRSDGLLGDRSFERRPKAPQDSKRGNLAALLNPFVDS
ncbi:hypothetical protein MTP99_015095 [Tenebrio molitor]|jgi:hypothetical protein|nr:hypothetical protein MTP99_015095 [Tenebrio molitor]